MWSSLNDNLEASQELEDKSRRSLWGKQKERVAATSAFVGAEAVVLSRDIIFSQLTLVEIGLLVISLWAFIVDQILWAELGLLIFFVMSLKSSNVGGFTSRNEYFYVKKRLSFNNHFGNPLSDDAKARIDCPVKSARSIAPFSLPSIITEFSLMFLESSIGIFWRNDVCQIVLIAQKSKET